MKRSEPVVMPKDGLGGLQENINSDVLSGFLVFLLALPLSLGIAKASDFPPIYGVITAIIGGVVVSIFAGSPLTIKGPAAGLIVICTGAVTEFGGGEHGWRLALGAIVVAGVIQVVLGFLKLGKYSDFIPVSAIHGMLAAVGITIFAKQIHTLLGADPKDLEGLSSIALLERIPTSLLEMNTSIAMIGIISLLIMFGMPLIQNKIIKRIPAPLIVLLISIPMAISMDFKNTQPGFSLVKVGSLIDSLSLNVDFSGIQMTGVFIKYVILFCFVSTIESVLTVKAIDGLDPYHRKSDIDKDILAIGIGNVVSGLLGGLPIISEVTRSAANVNNGAKTRWANFFHGLSLLVFVLLATPVIEMIPNAALAAMLIFIGYRLASPKEFRHMYEIGWQQLVVFLATIIVTMVEGLLIGVLAGIAIKLFLNLFLGKTQPKNIFKAQIVHSNHGTRHEIRLSGSATFSNYLSIKKKIDQIPTTNDVIVDLSGVTLADHTVIANLEALGRDFQAGGGQFSIIGLEELQSLGHTDSSTHRKVNIARMHMG
ncbi:SulP family inorganic anion transporter [Cytophagaceae bacterium YF14B1]|uniref:SulP family inorganic anion transporter n=1 Tax=Xanthocytophaga flava TaxID=3048013 RepID=A0AAE3U8A0_9BACT|nr:SulP family inorganic anion transporter [Xanthocytophaga flavus]MDJ1480978.1 SulP family inorganic anion transporter [Xanthocytophaga flavus]